jgi:hypothetical protein
MFRIIFLIHVLPFCLENNNFVIHVDHDFCIFTSGKGMHVDNIASGDHDGVQEGTDRKNTFIDPDHIETAAHDQIDQMNHAEEVDLEKYDFENLDLVRDSPANIDYDAYGDLDDQGKIVLDDIEVNVKDDVNQDSEAEQEHRDIAAVDGQDHEELHEAENDKKVEKKDLINNDMGNVNYTLHKIDDGGLVPSGEVTDDDDVDITDDYDDFDINDANYDEYSEYYFVPTKNTNERQTVDRSLSNSNTNGMHSKYISLRDTFSSYVFA